MQEYIMKIQTLFHQLVDTKYFLNTTNNKPNMQLWDRVHYVLQWKREAKEIEYFRSVKSMRLLEILSKFV